MKKVRRIVPRNVGVYEPGEVEPASFWPRLNSRNAQTRFRARLARSAHWIRATGLLPPEARGFTPKQEGDERPAKIDRAYETEMAHRRAFREQHEREYVEPYPHKPKWSMPATADDYPPSWDNVVRALEEDR